MAAIGTQVVLYALLVADIYKDVLEDAALRVFAHRNGQSALQHILQQTYCLQAYTLSAGIRTADDEDALFLVQFYLEWDNLLSLFLQGECQKGMPGKGPVDKGILLYLR